jgi:hypothetical protein
MTDKEMLQKLQHGERLHSRILKNLWRKGLIEVHDITNMDSPLGETELLFTFFTEAGRKVLGNG